MFLIIFSPKLQARLCALPPAVAEVSFFTPHLLAVKTQAGSDACGQKLFQFCCQGNWKVFENVYQANGEIFQWNKKKKRKHQWLWALLTALTVVTLEGLGGSSLIFCSMFQVCMCHLILGSYREQALDQELDFFQVTMRQITLKSYRLQQTWMICCITTTTTTTSSIWNNCIHFMKQYDLLHTVSLNYNRQTQNVRWWKMLQGFPWCPKRD